MHKNEFQKYLQSEKRFSVHTVTAYLNDVNQFLEFIGNAYGELPINKVDHKVIRSWLVYLVSDAQISNNSVNRKLSSIKTYFRFLQLIEVVNVSPTLKVIAPKVSKRLPEFVDQTSMDKFLGVNVFDKSFDGMRDQLVIELLYQTGIRLSELLSITVNDVLSSTGAIRVLGKRNKERIVPVNKQLLCLANAYIECRSDLHTNEQVLLLTAKGKPAYPKLIYKIVNTYLGQVSTVNKKSPHILRHTFATHMLNNGADLNTIKELLGHASLSATQIYTHNSFEKLKSIYNQAHPRA
jgi:integrase/recombinase XerC